MLRQEKELSAELYTFHEAVSQLQEIEDDVLDNHKTFMELQQSWLQRTAEIFNRTKEVDFDQDGNYAKFVRNILQFVLLPLAYTVVFIFALPYFCEKSS